MQIERTNNFDLLRLFAALTVMIWHASVHLEVFDKMYYFLACFYHFPGVPIFFTISGFLITNSLERSNFNLKKYFKNRALRIYPALWLCTFITAILLLSFGIVNNYKDFIIWLITQLSFFQFFAPTSLKTWGVGHPNGSLWSIAVELQFYFTLPIIIFVISKIRGILKVNIFLIFLFCLSITFRFFVDSNYLNNISPILSKLSGNFILYYLHFFLTGIILYKNFGKLKVYIYDKALYWLAAYLIYILVFKVWLKLYESPYSINIFGIIANTLLSFCTLSFAFSFRNLSNKLLNHNDISYGLYIYHMPLINLLVTLNQKGSIINLIELTVLTIILSILSWKLVEQKIMILFK